MPDNRELLDRLGRVEEDLGRVTAQLPKVRKIKRLSTSATSAEIIAKINELLDRMQERG